MVGLTCRVGRAVYGTSEIIEDIIQSGKSILLLGRPGVGKTTLLREAARIPSDPACRAPQQTETCIAPSDIREPNRRTDAR